MLTKLYLMVLMALVVDWVHVGRLCCAVYQQIGEHSPSPVLVTWYQSRYVKYAINVTAGSEQWQAGQEQIFFRHFLDV
jgi:hypothetical protein